MKQLLLSALLVLLCGCTAVHQNMAPGQPDRSPETAQRVAALVLADEMPPTPLIMRHMIRLHMAGKGSDLTFHGIMRFDPKTQTARVVGMGGFGLKMFDLTVTPRHVTTHFLHPGIARISHAADRIAFCIRRIWMSYGPGPQDILTTSDKATVLVGHHGDVLLRHRFVRDTRVSTTARGHKETWHILFENHRQKDRLPGTITFFDDRNDYSLVIKLIGSKHTGPTT